MADPQEKGQDSHSSRLGGLIGALLANAHARSNAKIDTTAVSKPESPAHGSLPGQVSEYPPAVHSDRSTQDNCNRPTSPEYDDLAVAFIGSSEVCNAFRSVWRMVPLESHSWKALIQQSQPDFLLAEAIFQNQGNSRSKDRQPGDFWLRNVMPIAEYCRAHGIPSVVWAPLSQFSEAARENLHDTFNLVMTPEFETKSSRSNSKDRLASIYLPYAADPRRFNPIRHVATPRKISSRKAALLPDCSLPGSEFGSESELRVLRDGIAKLNEKQPPQELVKEFPVQAPGSAASLFEEFETIVTPSPSSGGWSVCPPVVLEATAAGNSVVTNATPAVFDLLSPDLISAADSAPAVYHWTRALIRSAEFADRKVHAAQRKIWTSHTYSHRGQAIMEGLDLSIAETHPLYSFFCSTNRPSNLEIIFENFARQSLPNKELLILFHGFVPTQSVLEQLQAKYGVQNLTTLTEPVNSSLGKCLNRLVDRSQGEVLFRLDDDDYYGANYALDLANALQFSGAHLAGKGASYVYFEGLNSTVLTQPDEEHRFTDFVRGPTFAGPRSTFEQYRFPEMSRAEDSSVLKALRQDGKLIYSSDRFNFALRRSESHHTHTWSVDSLSFFSMGEWKFSGFDPKQIDA